MIIIIIIINTIVRKLKRSRKKKQNKKVLYELRSEEEEARAAVPGETGGASSGHRALHPGQAHRERPPSSAELRAATSCSQDTEEGSRHSETTLKVVKVITQLQRR